MQQIPASIFRAYDIRGVVGDTLTVDGVRAIGQAVASLYPQSPRVAVGRDGRLSSPELARALCEGLAAAGRTAIDIGEVPTPVLYYAAHKLETGAGIMITGSHNPPQYNGIKLVMGGETLYGPTIQAIREKLVAGSLSQGQGRIEQASVVDAYVDRIASDVVLGRRMRIGVDCGNGVAGPVVLKLLERLGADVYPLYCEVDGRFPNHHPNPSEPENLHDLMQAVQKEKLEVGLAFDGDGDRLGVIDEHGKVIWADRQMMLYATDVLSRNPGAEILYDVKSSRFLGTEIRRLGGRPRMWKTGHSFIKAKMKETGALLAGEMSGHIFFKERWYGFDDGLYCAARLLEILSKDCRTVSEIFASYPEGHSTPEITLTLAGEGAQHEFMKKFVGSARFEGATVSDIDGVRADYADGFGLARASNTTPSLVLRFEAESDPRLKQIQSEFKRELLRVDPALQLPF